LRAVVFLAQEYDSEKSFSLAEIAQKEQLPFPFLEQIFRKLKKSRLVDAHRGAQGGYRLSRPPKKVTVLEVIEAVSGKISLIDCNKDYCPDGKCCVVPLLDQLHENIENTLSKTKLSDLVAAR